MFLRRYILDIGKPFVPYLPPNSNITIPQGFEYYPEFTQQGIKDLFEDVFYEDHRGSRITELNVAFEIEKTKELTSNACEITIYNMSASSLGILSANSGLKPFIRLRAGYSDGEVRQLFKGVVERVVSTFEGKERITKITCSDAPNFKWALSAHEFPKGTAYKTIIDKMVQDVGLPKGTFVDVPLELVTTKPVYLYGRTDEMMRQLGSLLNIEFSVADLQMIATAKGAMEETVRDWAPLITPSGGLIGSIEPLDESSSSTPTDAANSKAGVKFKSLLRGDILPGHPVALEGRSSLDGQRLSGLYKVTKATHKGEYEGQDWYTEVEAEAIDLTNYPRVGVNLAINNIQTEQFLQSGGSLS